MTLKADGRNDHRKGYVVRKPIAARTVNPLHFEDLEPHRFEDLIRQLAYGFRTWSRLEATGRLGGDEGTDIRGLEVITAAAPLDDETLTDGEDEQDSGAVLDEREWRIQCKRYQAIGPKLMRSVVDEAVPDPPSPPYGLIIAAACDVSAKTIAAFHDERINRGVREAHLWTKAHLEDMLFHPDNDHLLFAYFGISLGVRRRSELKQVQSRIALKRKLLRAFEKKSLDGFSFEDVIIRNIEDRSFPEKIPGGNREIFRVDPWFTALILQAYSEGLVVSRFHFDGCVREDWSWDILRDTATVQAHAGHYDYDPSEVPDREHEKLAQIINEHLPKNEQHLIRLVWFLPYESILEVDPIGEAYFGVPHLYCRYSGELGPFTGVGVFTHRHSGAFLEEEKHRPTYKELAKKHLSPEDFAKLTFLEKKRARM